MSKVRRLAFFAVSPIVVAALGMAAMGGQPAAQPGKTPGWTAQPSYPSTRTPAASSSRSPLSAPGLLGSRSSTNQARPIASPVQANPAASGKQNAAPAPAAAPVPTRPPAEPAPANTPSAEQALKLTPIQGDIDYSQPKPDEIAQCKVAPQKIDGNIGWVVEDGQGVILRKFVDTNGDNKVDQWCYYKDGLEVYRDIDSNFNGKADQYRWFHTGGSRWGIDKDEDGTIDSWAAISAEEATAEAVAALAKQDPERFARLVLTSAEARSLGLGEAKTRELNEKIAAVPAKFGELARQPNGVKASTKWVHFSGTQPGVVPAGSDGSTKDLQVYENVIVVVETGADHSQLQMGTLVKVGDTWRLIDAPQAINEGQADLASAGFFFRVAQANRPQTATPPAGVNEKTQEILAELEKLDEAASRAGTAEEQARFQAKRAELLERMAAEATKPEDRAMWLRQLVDMLGAAVQSGGYPEGVNRLEALFEKLKGDADRQLAAHVKFVLISADYATAVQKKGADFTKVQAAYLKQLEQFVNDYPQSPDAAEAMLQLGLAQEFAGQEDDARKWYSQAARDFADAAAGKKAAGARTRLDCAGKLIQLRGKGASGETVDLVKLRGRAVLIQYWATWCEPCKADMATLKDLVDKYGRSGFAVVGVNLDNSPQAAAAFLKDNSFPWPQICEEGGLDGRPAVEMGILTLPTMILVDQDGKVLNRNITISELTSELRKASR